MEELFKFGDAQNLLYTVYADLSNDKIVSITSFDEDLKYLIGKDISEFCCYVERLIFWKEDRDHFRDAFSSIKLKESFNEEDKYHSFIYRAYLSKQKQILYLKCNSFVLRNEITKEVFAVLSIHDITERVLLHRILLGEYSRESVFMIAIEEKSENIVFKFSDSQRSKFIQLGLNFDDVISDRIKQKFEDKNIGKICKALSAKTIKEKLIDNKIYTYQFTISDSDDDKHSFDISCRYFDDDCGYICVVCTDITELFHEQEMYKDDLVDALSAAENANIAKTEFLSRMSHDTRTPLNGIIGLTRLAIDEHNPTKIKNYLNEIDSSSKYLLGLINDILDMSRIESGKMELHNTPCSAQDIIDSITPIIKPLCDEKNQKLNIRFMMGFPNFITDKFRLAQICVNLLSNSSKYSNQNSEISFIMRYFNAGRNYLTGVRIEVIDNGIGMSEAFVKKAFEPFSRESVGNKTETQGTGLGLAIVSSLVKLMDGRINIESTVGKGTRVIVHLVFPIVEKGYNQNEISSDEYGSLNFYNKRILVAEDNLINATIMRNLLENKNISVEVAENGSKALTMFMETEANYYDAILMDIRMPIMDGLEATKKIRSLTRIDAMKIPIIAITANAFEEDVKQCKSAGMTAHLSKPIIPEKLYEMLSKYLNVKKIKN